MHIDLYINHPAADGAPVGIRRWLLWQYSEWLYGVLGRLQHHQRRVEHRALYPGEPLDDIPF